MMSQESILIVGAAISALVTATGFLSANAFNRLFKQLDLLEKRTNLIESRVARLEERCRIHHPQNPNQGFN